MERRDPIAVKYDKPIAIDIDNNPKDIIVKAWNHTPEVTMFASEENLKSLTIPEGVTRVFCDGNHLTKLKLPSSLNDIYCDKELFNYDKCKVKNVNIYY